MGDSYARVGSNNSSRDIHSTTYTEAVVSAKPQFIAYRPPEFTPPASPQPQNPYAAKRGFGSGRTRHPAHLQMDTAATPVTGDHQTYSTTASPVGSPTLPPLGLPSPKYQSRPRAPSLLRHAAVPSPSPLNNGHPHPDHPTSPIMAPAMMRQGSGPGSPDLRAIFNPLASNPVNQSGPAWESVTSDPSSTLPSQRARGLTSVSQSGSQAYPQLRSVTSIPDYSYFRGNDRANLSGTYKPNRGVPNWSHTDYYPPPPKHFREEPRSSFRSAWTNASSFVEASGTERSSIATARSSVASEHPGSIYSRDQSRDRLRDRDDSPETMQTSEAPEEDYSMDAVDDFIDAYCYDEDDEEPAKSVQDQRDRKRLSSSPLALDSDPPELSQTPSRDLDSLSSFHSSEHLKQWDESPSPLPDPSSNSTENVASRKPLTIDATSAAYSQEATNTLEADFQELGSKNSGLAVVENSQFQPLYSPRTVEAIVSKPAERQSNTWQRSSAEIPRRLSTSLQALALGAPNSMVRPSQPSDGQQPRSDNAARSKLTDIRRDIAELPQIPTKKSRMSRQDWASIEAYSKRHSKRPSGSRTLSNDSTPGREGDNALQSPPIKKSEPLPEVDEDEAIPRRASTSVYDRRSALFNLGMIASAAPPNSKPLTPRGTSFSSQNQPNGVAPAVRKTAAPAERDRYGFKKASDKINVQQYNTWAARYEEHISRRRNKWIALMSKQGLATTEPTRFPEMCEKVKRYARKGYPPEWRGAMWWYYSGGQHTIAKKEMVGLYASLVNRVKQGELNKDDKDAIERDLDRTFPDNIHFRPEPSTDLLDGESDDEPQLIQDLREVLSCFALNNPNIGYCQSLNFIAGLLLLFLKQDKERAFILLTIITQHHLPGAHARSLANTEVNVLMMLIKDYLPKVWASINDTDLINSGAGSYAHPNSKFQRQPTVALSCTSWFMSIFVGVLPIETVLRVWDSFLYEGPRALYRYALAIFKLGEADIRKYRPSDPELFMIVQNLPRTCLDPNILHDLAFVKKGFGSLSQTVIDQKRLFWREQNKIAHQTSVRSNRAYEPSPPPRDEDTDADSTKRSIHGLRRRASRRFRRMRG